MRLHSLTVVDDVICKPDLQDKCRQNMFLQNHVSSILLCSKKHLVGVRNKNTQLKYTGGKCFQVSLEVYSGVMFYKRQELWPLVRNIRRCDTCKFWNTESTAVTTCWKSVHKHVKWAEFGRNVNTVRCIWLVQNWTLNSVVTCWITFILKACERFVT